MVGGTAGCSGAVVKSAGGGWSPSPASDTPSSRTPPSGTAARARRCAVAVSAARSVLASAAVSERVAVVKSALRTLTVTVRAARPEASSLRCADSASRATASCTALIAVRSTSKVVSALTCLAAPRGATGRSSTPWAKRCSSVPTAPPSSLPASRASRAASSPTVWTPARCSASSATGPTPHSMRTGSGARTSCWVTGSMTRRPSGFASSDAILASCLPEPAPTEAGSPVAATDVGPQRGGEPLDLGRCGPRELRRLEERLVERDRLYHWCRLREHVHDLFGEGLVQREARGQHGGVRAQPPGLAHRHGRAGAIDPRLVAGARHDTARPEAADEHGPLTQRGPGELLGGGVERVHVQVQHPARPGRPHGPILPEPPDSSTAS